MEENLHKDEFEQFLRKSTDEFRMIPSRKVWYSIYNDMHPDRKWPSLTVCMLILSAVLFIGISNNNSIGNAARRAGQENLNGIARNFIATKSNNMFDPVVVLSAVVARSQHRNNVPMPDAETQDEFSENISSGTVTTAAVENINFDRQSIAGMPENTDRLLSDPFIKDAIENNKVNAFAENTQTSRITKDHKKPAAKTVQSDDNNVESEFVVNNISAGGDITATDATKKAISAINEKTKAVNNIVFIEDFAFHNKPAAGKFRRNASMSYYITPSLGYRKLSATNPKYANNNHGEDNYALNLEAGTTINYALNDRFRIKGGLQVNYINYTTLGTELGHTSQAQLATSNASQFRASEYSTEGNTTLNHTTFQLSVPLGADMLIAGNDKFQWYVGANVQPAYVIGGNALMLSLDGKNLISDKSMRRNFNINTAAETFISYKTGAGIILNAGPQVRYQILSSFKNPYVYKENLFNTGVRIGLTKSF